MIQASFNIRNVANVVHSWIGYLYEVSETKHLAAESSLRYPITGLLERKGEISNIELEKIHPYFSQKRIDFYWKMENVENYLEMKYVRSSYVNAQKILNDVFRLALIGNENTHKYFLVCGKIEDFQKYFQNFQNKIKAIEKMNEGVKILQSGDGNKLFDSYFSFCEKIAILFGII